MTKVQPSHLTSVLVRWPLSRPRRLSIGAMCAPLQLLAAAKERVNLADKDDETRSNILVNKKGATWLMALS
jgi:hypothetical protein